MKYIAKVELRCKNPELGQPALEIKPGDDVSHLTFCIDSWLEQGKIEIEKPAVKKEIKIVEKIETKKKPVRKKRVSKKKAE